MCTLARFGAGVLGLFCVGIAVQSATQLARAEEVASADFLVQQALEAESRGDVAGRAAKLDAALEKAPELAAANWMLGRVKTSAGWQSAVDCLLDSKGDEEREYAARRAKAAGDIKERFALAIWCKQRGWQDRADLHYAQTLYDPAATHEMQREAVKQLDLVAAGDRWVPREQAREEEERSKAVAKSLETWTPVLERYRAGLESESNPKQQFARQKLHEIDDSNVVPAVEQFAMAVGKRFPQALVELLARIDTPESSQALTRFAVFNPDEAIREQATAALQKRPLHEFVPLLMVALEGDMEMSFGITAGPNGGSLIRKVYSYDAKAGKMVSIRDREEIIVVDRTGPVQHTQLPTPGPRPGDIRLPAPQTTTRKFSTPFGGGDAASVGALAEAQASQARLEQLQLAARNFFVRTYNQRFAAILERVSGQAFGTKATAWWDWWQSHNDTSVRQKYPCWTYHRSFGIYRTTSSQPRGYQISQTFLYRNPNGPSCFPAGTKVWTESGVRNIETVKAGDRVLSQDPETGELAYRVVLNTTSRPDAELLKLQLTDETITASIGHPFWVNKRGWQMTKELKSGDVLHTLDGCVELQQAERLPGKATVYNLVVADWNTFFVGLSGVLVHDVTYRQPTRAIVPGLVAK